MKNGGIYLVVGGAALIVLLLLVLLISRRRRPKSTVPAHGPTINSLAMDQAAKDNVTHIFDEAFREELRNRGRLHFEKVIGENAMFLQQDLRQTTSQLNDYMRAEITKTLQEEFKKYEQSIADAKQLALDSIDKTITKIDQQRQLLQTQLQTQSEAQKTRIIEAFEKEMAGIVNHYVLRAIGNQIDLTNQLEFILSELEANKGAMIEDIKRGT